mgnify:CR=1 FL=1
MHRHRIRPHPDTDADPGGSPRSGRGDDVTVSTDPNTISVRQSPARRDAGETVADFTTLVRIPGTPATFRAYTHAERAEAEAFAASVDGTVIELPLPLPDSPGAGTVPTPG